MMSLNIKTEPLRIEEHSSIVELSSDDDTFVENPNNAPKPILPRPDRQSTPETHCSICLDVLSNRCYSEACSHVFCFECLKRWSAITSSCPLCKKYFTTIFHTFNDGGSHETFEVPMPAERPQPRLYLRPFAELHRSEIDNEEDESGLNLSFFIDLMRRSNTLLVNTYNNFDQNDNLVTSEQMRPGYIYPRRAQLNDHVRRASVYMHSYWSLPLPDINGRYRECSLEFYRENPALTHRLHEFIFREVAALRSILSFENLIGSEPRLTNDQVSNIILLALMNYDLRSVNMANHLVPYLGRYVNHFVHELRNYALSPYDLVGYDRNVRYGPTPNHSAQRNSITVRNREFLYENPERPLLTFSRVNESEVITLDTSSDDDITETSPRPFHPHEIIVLSSTDSDSEHDSEVEIIEHHIRPNYDLSFRDQPSTSTGIRDSLNRPNGWYNLRKRKVRRPISSSGRTAPQITWHTTLRTEEEASSYTLSSNDEGPSINESTISGTQVEHAIETNILCGKRKKKMKRRKNKKQNKDESPELSVCNTKLPYSDCSSSDESDTRHQIDHTSVC